MKQGSGSYKFQRKFIADAKVNKSKKKEVRRHFENIKSKRKQLDVNVLIGTHVEFQRIGKGQVQLRL